MSAPLPGLGDRQLRILSIDGGGIRGVIPAKVLARIEELTKKRCLRQQPGHVRPTPTHWPRSAPVRDDTSGENLRNLVLQAEDLITRSADTLSNICERLTGAT